MNNVKYAILGHRNNDVTKNIYNVKTTKCEQCEKEILNSNKFILREYDKNKCIKQHDFCSLNCAKKYGLKIEKSNKENKED